MGTPKREFTCSICGKTCQGHGNRKYCSDECAKEGHRRLFKLRYETHHEEELARHSAYCKRNREKRNKLFNAWYARNKDKYNALRAQRRREKKEAEQ